MTFDPVTLTLDSLTLNIGSVVSDIVKLYTEFERTRAIPGRVIAISVLDLTRNTFCGTWYLHHSHVHNERTVPIIMAGCMVHARNGYISTSGQKSDVTIVFLDPDFL